LLLLTTKRGASEEDLFFFASVLFASEAFLVYRFSGDYKSGFPDISLPGEGTPPVCPCDS